MSDLFGSDSDDDVDDSIQQDSDSDDDDSDNNKYTFAHFVQPLSETERDNLDSACNHPVHTCIHTGYMLCCAIFR